MDSWDKACFPCVPFLATFVHMPAETDIWAGLIGDVVGELDALLVGMPSSAWQSPAANVGWSCRDTADHIAGDFAHYAAQIVGQPPDHYVKFSFDTSRATTAAELCEVVRVAGGLLAAAVRTAGPHCLGWHPHGYFTAAGFAAIGAAEGLVHGYDIAAGVGMPWSPGQGLCEQVLRAVFPVADTTGRSPALRTLLIQTGRDSRPEGAPPPKWSYSAAAALPLSAAPPAGTQGTG
jgi:uncharacterized protein (TIGR03083 family)